jgi:molybdopterin converting factor small subunit
MITVKVKFVGVLHEVFKKKQMTLKLAQSPTVKEIVEQLAETSSAARRSVLEAETNQIHPALLILVNGKEISALNGAETRVKDGDEVVLISVSHGG